MNFCVSQGSVATQQRCYRNIAYLYWKVSYFYGGENILQID